MDPREVIRLPVRPDRPGISAGGNVDPQGADIPAALADLLKQATHALKHHDATGARNCIDRAYALLKAEANRVGDNGAAPVQLNRSGLAPWQIRRVKQHIADNLGSPIRMSDFEEITRLSTSYFSRAFKGSFGISPHAYIVRRRVERAQEMMLETDEALSQIALACGLCDQAHFSKLFRRVTGTTPNAWRRERRGEPGSKHIGD